MMMHAGSEEAALAALVDAATHGLLLLSSTGTILRSNDAAAHLLGTTRDALRHRHLDQVLSRTGWEPGFLAQALATGGVVSRAYDLGTGRKALISARTTKAAPGEAPLVAITIQDVSSLGALVSRLDEKAPSSKSRASDSRRASVPNDEADGLIAESPALRAVKAKALDFAGVDSPVLVVGETGTGKNVIARLIHRASKRRAEPLREVNCGAIPAGLIESELFGYARGAFTGADSRGKIGLVELAHNGTLLLDEIGDLPHPLQVKLLSFLEAGEIWPVGASKPRQVDVRIIAATNADLAGMVSEGGFRKDLFYRLNVLVIHVPPLRERPEDIPPLVELMLRTLHAKLGKRVQLTSDALAMLVRYPFPGNVRELRNLVERLVVCARVETVDVPDLPLDVVEAAVSAGVPASAASLKDLIKKLEAGIVRDALARYGTQSKAAKHLGVGQATIARKARLYDIGESLRRRSVFE